MTDTQRDELLLKIHSDIEVMKTKLDNDYRIINGNGQPGLVARVADIEKKLAVMNGSQHSVLQTLAWLATFGVAAYAAFFK